MILHLANQLAVNASIRANAYTTANGSTIDGTAVDIGEAVGNIDVIVDAAQASSGETLTFTVQHSYDGSTNWVAVGSDALVSPSTGATATVTVNNATTAVLETLALKRDRLRRYVRVLATAAGDGSPSYKCAAYILFTKMYD